MLGGRRVENYGYDIMVKSIHGFVSSMMFFLRIYFGKIFFSHVSVCNLYMFLFSYVFIRFFSLFVINFLVLPVYSFAGGEPD